MNDRLWGGSPAGEGLEIAAESHHQGRRFDATLSELSS